MAAKEALDAANIDTANGGTAGDFTAKHKALQHALDVLLDLGIAGRPDSQVSPADRALIETLVTETKALLAAGETAGDEAADKAAYEAYRVAATQRKDDPGSTTNDDAFTAAGNAAKAAKVAEVYRVVDNMVLNGGGLTATDGNEDGVLARLLALNTAKKALDDGGDPTLAEFGDFQDALAALKAAGADERLAEAIVEGLTAADTSRLATRTDLAIVRTEIADLRSELKLEIAGVRSNLLKYMIGLFLAQAGLLVAVLRFYPL